MEKNGLSATTVRMVRICLLIAGVGLFLAAFLFDSVTSSTSNPNWSKSIIVLLGGILIGSGIAIGTKKHFFARISMFLSSILIAFLVVEFLGIASLFLLDKFKAKAEIDPKEAELRINSGTYRPYVLWRASPQSTDNLTILDSGLRDVPGASVDPSALQVFVFGGSTIVGWNTTDDATICAHIQRAVSLLADKQVCVTNFGQQGYVNTQQLIELQLQLRSGNIPDLVVFYDGTNEIWSAVESDTAGMHFGLQRIADLYENRNFTRNTSTQYEMLQFAGELNAVSLLRRILGQETETSALPFFEAEPSRCVLYGEDFMAPADFAREIMGIYESDLRILRALSNEFDFEYRVFWQPVILTGNKPLTNYESAIYDDQILFILHLYQECALLAEELENRYDEFNCITDVFDGVEETVFQDICHLNALGDSLIAERILQDLPAIDQKCD